MSKFIAVVHIMPHDVLLDPAGKTTMSALEKMKFEGLTNVRIGKRIEITLEATDEQDSLEKVTLMANSLLVNPIVEYFNIEIKSV